MTTVGATLRGARTATFAVFALNGFVLGMWVVNIPEIRDRTGASTEQLGYLILLLGLSALAGMQVSGRLVDRVGSGPVMIGSGLVLSLSLAGPSFATSVTGLAVALAGIGVANGSVDVAQNSHAVEVEAGYRRPIMSAFHAFFSLGGLLAALIGGAMISLGADLRWTLSLGAVAGIAVCLWTRPHVLVGRTADRVPDGQTPAPRGAAAWTSRVVLIALLAFALLLSEGVAYDWSTVHLHDSLGADRSLAAWGFGAFSVAMTTVRLLADRIVARIGSAAYVQRAAFVGAVGLAGAALAPTPWLAILGWSVFGIGLAGCVPQFFSAAGRIDPDNAGLYMARVTSLGYLGLLTGPALIGILTRWVSLSTTFILPIVACALAGLLARRALAPA